MDLTGYIITQVFLLFIQLDLTKSREVKHAALSSDITFCFKPCKPNNLYKIYHGIVTIYIPCHATYQIPDKFEGRISVKETTGCITLSNVTEKDGGLYTLEHKNGNGKKETYREIMYILHEQVWIHELFRNVTNRTISLTVVCPGEPDTIIWRWGGGDLPDWNWLSGDNRSITVPDDVTGMITVHVSNRVSTDSKNITLIKDLNGKSGHLGRTMFRNMTRVIWGPGGGRPGNQTLSLPRNITSIFLMNFSAVPSLMITNNR
ncbi:uncharacterized protein LOC142665240 isoform X2 [Rhinoderma darwinii]|uniref:uncharacterized protein LOC142665240 isoform X2 n=1 Tax=Rhinoderma darwinii TaxID=43563 RepID=UPI003F669665